MIVAAFEGWNDAGDAATEAVEHLEEVWGAEPLCELDPEDYYDFQVNRPHVELDDDGRRRITWPTTRISYARLPATGARRRAGPRRRAEHALACRTASELLALADELGVEMVVTLGALLADTPHTRPVPVTGTASDPGCRRRSTWSSPATRGRPASSACSRMPAARSGCRPSRSGPRSPTTSRQPPCPKATLALLRRVEDLLDVPIPLGDLPEERPSLGARRRRAGLRGRGDRRLRRLARGGARHGDLPEASGEAIAQEFERYLRRRSDDKPCPVPGRSAIMRDEVAPHGVSHDQFSRSTRGGRPVADHGPLALRHLELRRCTVPGRRWSG